MFSCEICKYTTTVKQNYDKHVVSKKHINNNINVIVESFNHECNICCKKYKSRVGLWKHNKICKPIEKQPAEIGEILLLIKEIMAKQNHLEKVINEIQSPTNSHNNNASNNNASNNNNSHNLINNVIIMLNEKCSNAANIKDVIAAYTQTIGLTELKQIEHSNYVEGAAALATQALNVTNPLERSLYHVPGEKLSYVRDENTWKYEKKDNMPIIEGTIDILCEGIDKKITKQYSKRSTIEQKRIGRKLEHKKKNEPTVKKKIVENVLQTAICDDDTLKLE